MKEKYYTPDISEFYVGFECEWQSKIRNETWHKEICDMDLINIAYDSFEHEEDGELFKDSFRVKYLDRQDIESLGFKDDGYTFTIFLENYPDKYSKYNKGVTFELYLEDGVVSLLYQPDCLFCGIVKNKSELKKILKQVLNYEVQ